MGAPVSKDWKPGYRPSNGTDGDFFRIGPAGCDSCTIDHDGGWHGPDPDGGDSCPILVASLFGTTPVAEWEERGGAGDIETRCTAWRGPCSCTEGTTYQPPPPEWGIPRPDPELN